MIETANITLATTVTMLTVSSTESCQNRFGSKVMPLSLAVAGVEILIWIKNACGYRIAPLSIALSESGQTIRSIA